VFGWCFQGPKRPRIARQACPELEELERYGQHLCLGDRLEDGGQTTREFTVWTGKLTYSNILRLIKCVMDIYIYNSYIIIYRVKYWKMLNTLNVFNYIYIYINWYKSSIDGEFSVYFFLNYPKDHQRWERCVTALRSSSKKASKAIISVASSNIVRWLPYTYMVVNIVV
jgi:hypothetical protein